MKVEIIEKYEKVDLEEAVNKILKDDGWKISSIQYSTMFCNGIRVYSAMLVYKEDSYL